MIAQRDIGRAYAWSITVDGLDCQLARIDADVNPTGTDVVLAVGHPAQDSITRVHAAICRSQQPWPRGRVVVNWPASASMAPHPELDLAFAAAVLAAAGHIPRGRLDRAVLLGELDLDGRLRRTRGVLPALLAARQTGAPTAVVPADALAEASLVHGITVYGAQRLKEVVNWLTEAGDLPTSPPDPTGPPRAHPLDLADLPANHSGRLPLEVAAGGGHHMLLVGPVGSGAGMLAQRLPGLLPDMDPDQALRVASLRSLAGRPAAELPTPPFVEPHHTSSITQLLGGWTRPWPSDVTLAQARPGAVSLAQRGATCLEIYPHLTETGLA